VRAHQQYTISPFIPFDLSFSGSMEILDEKHYSRVHHTMRTALDTKLRFVAMAHFSRSASLLRRVSRVFGSPHYNLRWAIIRYGRVTTGRLPARAPRTNTVVLINGIEAGRGRLERRSPLMDTLPLSARRLHLRFALYLDSGI
jgi:hypothetical protein